MAAQFDPSAWTLVRSADGSTKYQSVDLIKAWLERDIKDVRISSYYKFCITVAVTPASDAHHSYWSGRWIGYDQYDFETPNNGHRIMRVRVESKGRVSLLCKGRWMSVAKYMRYLTPEVDENVLMQGLTAEDNLMICVKRQQCWWAANGKTFKFTGLPAEIRNAIYGYAFGDRVQPYPNHKSRKIKGTRWSPPMTLSHKPTSNFLFTSKQLYEEASHILFEETTFVVDRFKILRKLLANPQQTSRIRKLTLSMDKLCYFELFGTPGTTPDGTTQTLGTAERLREMDLKELKMFFPSRTASLPSSIFEPLIVLNILKLALPFVKSQPVQVFSCSPHELREFESVVAKERRHVENWHMLNEVLGLGRKSIKSYYEETEREEEDGGVALPLEG